MLLLLLASALVALLLAAAYTRWWNPEVQLYAHALRVKQEWARQLDREFGHKTIVFGGSATSFAVDPEVILRTRRLPVANYGLHAGMQTRFLTAAAAADARPGDLLVMALEPALLVTPDIGSDLAAQMGFTLNHPEWIQASTITGDRIHWVENIVSLRPGAYHFFTLLGKIITRRPLYRYAPTDFSHTGWQRTEEQRAIPLPSRWSTPLTPEAKQFLAALKSWADQHDVRVAYLLPWQYADDSHLKPFRTDNLRFLAEIARYLPVLPDTRLGAYSVREHFADTPLHLNPAGAETRSIELAELLASGDLWTEADLRQRLDTNQARDE